MFLDMDVNLVSVAAVQAELEELGMWCIQLATKFLFHRDFYSKKTLG